MERELSLPSRLEMMEELANALTHGMGCLLSILGFYWLLNAASSSPGEWKLISAILFGSSLITLYAASTLYHSFRSPSLKRIFKIVDHCAIYCLIAGSYTPFTLITLQGPWGWFLFTTIWSMAALGILFKVYYINRWPILSTLFYLAMGWLVVIAAEPLMDALHPYGLYLLITGGLLYTLGAIVYTLERPAFHHAIWHLFVLGGSTCHYFAVLHYVF